MRRFIAIAVVVLHVLLVWLLTLGFQRRADRVVEQPRLVTLWLEPLPEVVPAAPPPIAPPPRMSRAPTAPAPPPPLAPPVAPPTAPPLAPLVVTPPIVAEPVPAPEPPAPPPVAPAPPRNFGRAVAEAAARSIVEANAEAAAAAKKAETFSPPPKALAEPCKPPPRSMEFKGNDDAPGLHWVGPLPVLVTERCAFTLGAFACAFGRKPEANGHLLDDMKDPDRSRSSVPDPNKCD